MSRARDIPFSDKTHSIKIWILNKALLKRKKGVLKELSEDLRSFNDSFIYNAF